MPPQPDRSGDLFLGPIVWQAVEGLLLRADGLAIEAAGRINRSLGDLSNRRSCSECDQYKAKREDSRFGHTP